MSQLTLGTFISNWKYGPGAVQMFSSRPLKDFWDLTVFAAISQNMGASVLEPSDKERSNKLSSLDVDDEAAEEDEQEVTIIVQEEEKVFDNDH